MYALLTNDIIVLRRCSSLNRRRFLNSLLDRTSHWSSECYLHFCQYHQLNAREDEVREQNPQTWVNGSFLKSNF